MVDVATAVGPVTAVGTVGFPVKVSAFGVLLTVLLL